MAAASVQAPLLHPPLKKSDEVDFTPLKRHIATVYSEDPEHYANEIATLHRLRQDTRGAGKDITGRDILYRYYGQLDLLEVRFPIDEKNVKILFTWYDAFSQKSISQYSIAYEKASIIFNIAATCAAYASLQNRFEPAGQKVAFNYLQAAAGLFQYINENFLHAPSVDLSRDSIKCLTDLMLAQAQEVFLEKVIAEKKKGALVSKLAAQAAHFYLNAHEGLQAESVKNQFDKPWFEIVKIKNKLFDSIGHYHKSIQLENDGKYGESVAHATKAETLAKEAHKLATAFNGSYSSFSTYIISPSMSTTVNTSPTGSASAAVIEHTKLNLSLATERKNLVTKDNDIIYHDLVPSPDSLTAIDKVAIAKTITFAELCTNGQADVAKIIGPDIFQNLIPISVHEAASLYSEEKAKILRAEQDLCDSANEELHATLESMNLMTTLSQLKQFSKKGGLGNDETLRLPRELSSLIEEVRSEEASRSSSTEELLGLLEATKKQARDQLDEIGLLLDKEQFECEQQRAKYLEQWTQDPSAKLTSQIRQDVRQNRDSYEKAALTDQALYGRITEAKRESNILRRPIEEVESIFAELILAAAPNGEKSQKNNLLDDLTSPDAVGEQATIEKLESMLGQLRNLKNQRANLIAELKAKIHEDDIAGTLVLNKNRENQVFQSELSKFQPLKAQVSANLQGHAQILGALTSEFEKLKETSKSLKVLDMRTRKRNDIIRDWKRGYEVWRESKEGLKKGVRFYGDLNEIVSTLKSNVTGFVNRRNDERASLIKRIEEQSAFKGQQVLREQLAKMSVSGSPTGGIPGSYGAPPPRPAVPGYPSIPGGSPAGGYPPPISAAPDYGQPYRAPGNFSQPPPLPPPPTNPYAAPSVPAPYVTAPATAPYNTQAPPVPQHQSYSSAPYGGSGYNQPPPQGYQQPPSAYPGGYPSQLPHQPNQGGYPSQPPLQHHQGGYPSQPPQQPNYAMAPVGNPGYAGAQYQQYSQPPPGQQQPGHLQNPMTPQQWQQPGQGRGGSLLD
ncbi:bck1-like resistance to osmotic shock [Phlyctochytrium planicorne]|nr:bck1-like resistance to osmotic shock [Phlyctochytrium planicorne]